MKFDKLKVSNNIRQKGAEIGLKLGELETKAGMTAGYLSKWAKEEPKSNSSLDFVLSCSELLEVSLDSLTKMDFTTLSPSQKYLNSFFDKIIKQTIEGELVWNVEHLSMLKSCNYHPLFKVLKRNDSTYEVLEQEYESKFRGSVELNGNCYNVRINTHTLYLMNVIDKENKKRGYELYFVSPNNNPCEADFVNELCEAYSKDALHGIVESLYFVAKESAKQIKIDDSVRSIIDDFMNGIQF